MRKKEMNLVVTFHTTAEAMATEASCKKEGLAGRLIPVPRTLSAGCGLAWCAPEENEAALTALLDAEKIDREGVHHCLL